MRNERENVILQIQRSDHLSFLNKHVSHQRTTFTSHNPPQRKQGPLINPHISGSLSTPLLKMVIQMIIRDFTMIKARGGSRLLIQIIAQIVYVNTARCFASTTHSCMTAAAGVKDQDGKNLIHCFITIDTHKSFSTFLNFFF